jgi:hypothetical protein
MEVLAVQHDINFHGYAYGWRSRAVAGERGFRWMPWPATAPIAPDGGLLDAVEAVAQEISVAAMVAATAGNLKQRNAFWSWSDKLRAAAREQGGKA